MARTGPTNVYMENLIDALRAKSREEKAPIWRDVAEKLGKSTRQRVEMDLSDIDRNSADKETVVVPGIVLSNGSLTKTVTIAAWKFSEEAARKIKESKGKMITIEELMKENPKGSNVRILV